MKIRPVKDSDRDRLLEMGDAFFQASPYRALLGEANLEGLGRLLDGIRAMTSSACLVVAVDDRDVAMGMLIAIASRHPFNGCQIAEEVCWYVDPAARGFKQAGPKMLDIVEQWAQAMGVKVLKMIAPVGAPAVVTFYERMGYDLIESAYVKAFA